MIQLENQDEILDLVNEINDVLQGQTTITSLTALAIVILLGLDRCLETSDEKPPAIMMQLHQAAEKWLRIIADQPHTPPLPRHVH